MAQATRMKVKVADLLARVRAKQTEADRNFARLNTKYESDMKKHSAAVRERLERALKDLEAGSPPDSGYRAIQIPFTRSKPIKPVKENYAKEIALLEMAAEEFITVTTDSQWSKFL